METRALGRTGRSVGVVGLGCWQLGGDWGDVADEAAFSLLEAAVDAGVTFLDTADVYGDGRSERLVGSFLATWLGKTLGWYQPGETAGWIGSIIGAIILLIIYRLFTKKSATP